MSMLIRRWLEIHRYRATLRELKSLSSWELQTLWIAPAEIDLLARKASQL